jgi:hypothetical protein
MMKSQPMRRIVLINNYVCSLSERRTSSVHPLYIIYIIYLQSIYNMYRVNSKITFIIFHYFSNIFYLYSIFVYLIYEYIIIYKLLLFINLL